MSNYSESKSFDVTVIMSVYNVSAFIREAMDSLTSQTIGFEHIQLVFVDDGSTDDSGDICEEYKKCYPENVTVIHKENEGLAKARLTGAKYATGKYVSFFDPDDTLSPETMANVVRFFDNCGDTVDVVAIPIVFFGAKTGPHPLNTKFNLGTRVIDLLTEWEMCQLSLATSFVRREALYEFGADAEIVTAEDAIELVKILTNKHKLGVVAEAQYNYRRRSDSSVGGAQSKRGWYIIYLEHFSEWALRYTQDKLGYVPKYIQYTVLYDLQWKYRPQSIPAGVLSPGEEQIYRSKLRALAGEFDDDVIVAQNSINQELKLALLLTKHGHPPALVSDPNSGTPILDFDGFAVDPSSLAVTIRHLEITETHITIEYDQMIPCIGLPPATLLVDVSGHLVPAEIQAYDFPSLALGNKIGEHVVGRVQLLRPSHGQKWAIRFVTDFGNLRVAQSIILYGKYSRLVNTLPHSHYCRKGILVTPGIASLSISAVSKAGAIWTELLFSLRLLFMPGMTPKKAAIMRITAFIGRSFKKKPLWLICDKSDRADDNGEAFFLFLQSKEFRNINSYFLLGKNSPSYNDLQAKGKIIPYLSRKHRLFYLMADFVISAYSHEEINNPFLKARKYYADMLPDCKYVFLQHGITKDDISKQVHRFLKNMHLITCASAMERDSFVSNPKYGYPPYSIALTGFPRYDRLYHDEQNEIVIAPTWRRPLLGDFHPETSRYDLAPGFKQSAFFQFYESLLNSDKLLSAAEKYGFRINFVPHPTLFPYVDEFHVPDSITVGGEDVVYRDVFARNKLLVTDFSSVAFDFAYLRKPVVYCHFDLNHYAEGYFDYTRDGFGEIEYDLEHTIDRIIEYMSNDCLLKAQYRERIDRYFAFNDRNNCQRVYDAIISSENQPAHADFC